MTAKNGVVVALAIALCMGMSFVVLAQGKKGGNPSQPSSWPGTLQFRCPTSSTCVSADGIIGDGSDYQGTGGPETGEGAHLVSSNGELWLGIGAGTYGLTFYFPVPDDGPPCLYTSTGCRASWGSSLTIDDEDGEFQSNVLVTDDFGNEILVGGSEQETANGLLDIPVGKTWRSRLKINFDDPTGIDKMLWTLAFDAPKYAGATNLNVTRIGNCTWVFSPGEDDRAGLFAYGSERGKHFRTDEGLYKMPFQMTFNAPGCPAAP